MVSKPQTTSSLSRILVGIDGSENSKRAAKLAAEIAQREGSELTILSIVSYPNYPVSAVFDATALDRAYENYSAQLRKAADGYIQNALSIAKSQGVEATGRVEQVTGSTVEALVTYAQAEKFDLIVVGTRGLGGFKKLVLGSVSSGVVSHAHCPVLVVR